MSGQARTDEAGGAAATLLRRSPRRDLPVQGADGPAVRPTSVGAGPRMVPRRARQDWRAEALAQDGARPLDPAARFRPQRCIARSNAPLGDDWLHEIKWDGCRLLVELSGGNACLRSRDGQDWTPRFPEIVRAVESLGVDHCWLDGEVVALDAEGRSDFAALQRALADRDTARLRLLAFDLPALAGVDLSQAPLLARKRLLERLLAAQPSATLAFSRHIVGHGDRVLANSLRQGVEGIVSKRVDAPYAPMRPGDWVKVRHERVSEVVVVGYVPRGRRGRVGELLLASRESDGLRFVGRVKPGSQAALPVSLLARLRRLEQPGPPLTLLPAADEPGPVHWVRPALLVEVSHHGWDSQGRLHKAALRRLREDKDASELDTEPGMSIRITHPERIVFPAANGHAAVSKGEVADYYRDVARWMLPELVRRPLSLVRCPGGSESACFFQKHHSDSFGDAVRAIPLEQKDGVHDYLYVEDVDGLIALVQFNALEFHPWGSRVDAPEQPDRMVFDLDPDGAVDWKSVVAAARDVRARLREHGLESFVRQTGGKGLHVVAPIQRGPGWDDLKAFCEGVAGAMAAEHPDRYVATMSKAKREGRIFIDWLRNSRGATSVTSWSLRSRPGAPVAMPLRWDELGKLEGPAAFDLARARQRAARLRKDPWDGIEALQQRLPD